MRDASHEIQQFMFNQGIMQREKQNRLAESLEDAMPASLVLDLIRTYNDQEHALARLENRLYNGPNIGPVIGEPKQGKTSLVRWLASKAQRQDYKVFYRNEDFQRPYSWEDPGFKTGPPSKEGFPYRDMFKYVFDQAQTMRSLDFRKPEDRNFCDPEPVNGTHNVMNRTVELHKRGDKPGPIFKVHDEAPDDINAKTMRGKKDVPLQTFLRKIRKVADHIVSLANSTTLTEMPTSYLRMKTVSMYKPVSKGALEHDRSDLLTDLHTLFIPDHKTETVFIFENPKEGIYLDMDFTDDIITREDEIKNADINV